MADGGNQVRRRREAPERIEYRQALQHVANLVQYELGNGQAPQPRADNSAWKMQRTKTIRTLNELREKLDSICIGANYGKAVGKSAEIMGAVIAAVGAVMSLFGKPSGTNYTNMGNLAYNAGSLIDGVSNAAESIFSAKYMNDIEAVLKEDQELSRHLAERLIFSRELDANIEEIFGVSLTSEKWNIVIRVFQEFSKCCSSVRSFDATMRLMKQGRYSVYIGNDVKLEKLQLFFQNLSASPRLADRIRSTLSVLSESTKLIQSVSSGVQVYNSIMGVSSSNALTTLKGGLNPAIPTPDEVSIFCGFQAINIAVSFCSLINTARIIKNGTSTYSDALKGLTRALAWELEQMENS